MMCKIARRRGFTLAELIMAIALLAVFSVFIVQMFAKSDQLAKSARNLDQAVACASNLADQWKMIANDNVPAPILDLRQNRTDGRMARISLDSHFQICEPGAAVYKAELILHKGTPGINAAALKAPAPEGLWQLTLVIARASFPDSGPIYSMTVSRYFPEEVAVR